MSPETEDRLWRTFERRPDECSGCYVTSEKLERLAKWARRRPAVAGLLAALLVVLLLGTGASTFFAVRAGIARDRAEVRELEAVSAGKAAGSAGQEAGQTELLVGAVRRRLPGEFGRSRIAAQPLGEVRREIA